MAARKGIAGFVRVNKHCNNFGQAAQNNPMNTLRKLAVAYGSQNLLLMLEETYLIINYIRWIYACLFVISQTNPI